MKGGVMWWPNGFSGDEEGYHAIVKRDYAQKISKPKNTAFYCLNEKYGLSAAPFAGGLDGISLRVNYERDFLSGKISNLQFFETKTFLTRGGKRIPHDGARWLKHYDRHRQNEDMNPVRWIESCNLLQRFDFFGLSYQSDENVLGRLEVTALADYFVLRFEFLAHKADSFGAGLEIKTGENYTAVGGDGCAALKDKAGAGLVLVPTDGAQILADGDKIVVQAQEAAREAGKFVGFSVAVFPTENALPDRDRFFRLSEVRVNARQIFPQEREQSARFDSRYGYWTIDAEHTFGYIYETLANEENRKKMDRILFTLENPFDFEVSVPVMFERDVKDDFNPTGMCPILRDWATGEPCGVPILRTNNWHGFSSDEKDEYFYAPADDPRRSWQGIWYHGHTVISLAPREKKTLEYTCTYACWGEGAFPVSHANLSLVGYAGNQQWEQSALACYGESICYDPEVCLGRSTIDDIRPFQVDCAGRCQWTGNVGGGDFLHYFDLHGNHKRLKNMRTYYRSQGPNMTDVTYLGETIGDAIAAKINVRMGRTDDVVRIWYTLDYRVLQDTEFSRLDFFQINADEYGVPTLERLSFGTDRGIECDCFHLNGVGKSGVIDPAQNPWWYLSNNTSGEKGNLLAIVREYEGKNGEKELPCLYRIGKICDSHEQACLELTPAENKVTAGSVYRFKIEFIVMPGSRADYYGKSEYLLAEKDFDNPACALYQAREGKLCASASVGAIECVYPATVRAEPLKSGVAAEIELTGGVGYVPLVFEGVQSPHAELFVRTENGFEKIDQSLYGNDYWQCDSEEGGYRLVYNVPNRGARRYRLILKEEVNR